jgi:hypothetical protein
MWLDVPHHSTLISIRSLYTFLWSSESLSVKQVGFDSVFKMGVMQRSLGPIAGGVTPLKTPFIAALIALCLIWSIMSLDISRVRLTVVCSFSVTLRRACIDFSQEPVYTGVVNSVQQVEDEAIRIALESIQGGSVSSDQEADPVIVEVPVENPTSTPNTVEQPKESNEAGKKTPGSEAEPATTQENTANQLDQTSTELPQDAASNITTISPLPLVLYAYSESETARPNLEFFIRHALNSAADFVFILNGATDAINIIPKLPNIRIVQRDNDCYDLGAYAAVLQKDDLWKGYGKFIMLNASLRGPFMPYWSDACWMDMYLTETHRGSKGKQTPLLPLSRLSTKHIRLTRNQTNTKPDSS